MYYSFHLQAIGHHLLPLAPCKSILNTFDYEIYQKVFILFELSVKHTLSDFLLPCCCHGYCNKLLVYSDGKNYKSRPLDNISKYRRVIHILRHTSALCPVQWQFLNIIKDFIKLNALSLGNLANDFA